MSTIDLPGELRDEAASNRSLIDVVATLTRDRRRVLEVLLDVESTSVRSLATCVAAAEAGTRPAAVDEERVDAAHVDLVQFDLPALAGAGLVEWNRDGRTVEPTAHRVYETGWFQQLVGTDADVDGLLESLGDERRWHVLGVLATGERPLRMESLAEAVADLDPSSPPGEVALSLHHVDVPKLAANGLVDVESDGEDTLVAYAPTDVADRWFQRLWDVGL